MELGAIRLVWRRHGEPAISPLRNVCLLHEPQHVGVEAQGFLEVVHVDAGQLDPHRFPPVAFAALAASMVFRLGPPRRECFFISDELGCKHIPCQWSLLMGLQACPAPRQVGHFAFSRTGSGARRARMAKPSSIVASVPSSFSMTLCTPRSSLRRRSTWLRTYRRAGSSNSLPSSR